MLTLNFVLPLKAAVKAKSLQLEIYDPSYFVDFTFGEKDPVALKGAPASCKLAGAPNDPAQGRQVGEAFFNSLDLVQRLRRPVRQQDFGDMPLTPDGARMAPSDVSEACRG